VEQNPLATRHDFVLQNSAKQNPFDTRRTLAELAGVSHDTISKVEKIEQSATPEVISQLKRGDISINKAYQEINKQSKREEKASSMMNRPTPMYNKYDVIYCDFPWESDKDITALEIPAGENAIIFMWATTTMLPKALKVMTKWGFVYRTCVVWDKQIPDANDWLRGQHELLLIGTKGNYTVALADVMVFNSVYSEKCGEYSKKPGYFYDMIEKMCPGSSYLEVFAQAAFNNRWSVLHSPIPKEVGKE
jgi:N6-adenosine-specific RNA methylase IME4